MEENKRLEGKVFITSKQRNPNQGSGPNNSHIYYELFKLPLSLCAEIENFIKRFWWSQNRE